ncbi:hypothetical protein M0804_009685 [Polistes exclamans]|nr:hypothetical protein M0804_009685 [Polistes exclamans]
MTEYTLEETVQVLRTYHTKSENAGNTAAELLSKKYFEYPEVCVSVINYWYRFFNEHPPSQYPEITVTSELRFAYLYALLKINPMWSIAYFMDALKACNRTNLAKTCDFSDDPAVSRIRYRLTPTFAFLDVDASSILWAVNFLSTPQSTRKVFHHLLSVCEDTALFGLRINAGNTARELLSKKYFEHTEVCVAAIIYWFRFFNKHPTIKYQEFYVSSELQLAFLHELLRTNPLWSISYYMDALKACQSTVQNYIDHLDFVLGPDGWTQRNRISQ